MDYENFTVSFKDNKVVRVEYDGNNDDDQADPDAMLTYKSKADMIDLLTREMDGRRVRLWTDWDEEPSTEVYIAHDSSGNKVTFVDDYNTLFCAIERGCEYFCRVTLELSLF
jgi:hypothetical protein